MQQPALLVNGSIKMDPAVSMWHFRAGMARPTAVLFTWRSSHWRQRNVTSSHLIARLRPKLVGVRGATAFLQAGQDVRIGGRQSNAQYQYAIQGDNLKIWWNGFLHFWQK